MDELQDLINSIHQSQYKSRGSFGVNLKEHRISAINTIRKDMRIRVLDKRREIPENLTPINTPGKPDKPTTSKKDAIHANVNQATQKRIEQLQKWKQERDKKKQAEKLKQKPLFKVCHVPDVMIPQDLDKVYSVIKNKEVRKTPTPAKSKFAPHNHAFRPPANIKPINFSNNPKIQVKPPTPRTAGKEPLKKGASTSSRKAPEIKPQVSSVPSSFKRVTRSNSQKSAPPKAEVPVPARRQISFTSKEPVLPKVAPKKPPARTAKGPLKAMPSQTSIEAVKPIRPPMLRQKKVVIEDSPEPVKTRAKKLQKTPYRKGKVALSEEEVVKQTDETDSGPKEIKHEPSADDDIIEIIQRKHPVVHLHKMSIKKVKDALSKDKNTKSEETTEVVDDNVPKVSAKTRSKHDLSKEEELPSSTEQKKVFKTPRKTPRRKNKKHDEFIMISSDQSEELVTEKGDASTHSPKKSFSESDIEVNPTNQAIIVKKKIPCTPNKELSESQSEDVKLIEDSEPKAPRTPKKKHTESLQEENSSGSGTPSKIPRKSLKTPKSARKVHEEVQKTGQTVVEVPRKSRTPKKKLEDETVKTPSKIPKQSSKTPRKTPKKLDVSQDPEKLELSAKKPTLSRQQAVVNDSFESDTSINKKTPRKSSVSSTGTNDTSISTDYPIDCRSESDGDFVRTPVSQDKLPQEDENVTYVSPFVCISRGTDKARREFHARKSGLAPDSPSLQNSTSPKAGAKYFLKILNDNVRRITEVCNQWNYYKEIENPPEEASELIDVAVGQSNLLMTKKFEQFRGLIEKCAQGTDLEEKPITCEDLHGFWDMIYMQVVNLDKRFENLTRLRENNWQEVIPEIKKEAPKKKKQIKRPKATSSLKDAIRAARLRKKNSTETESEPQFNPKEATPQKVASPVRAKTPKSVRKSILQTVLTNEAARRLSSPGLTMMKVSQAAKSMETPSKGILKTDASKSSVRKSKAVLFNEDISVKMCSPDKENTKNSSNFIFYTPEASPTPTKRASARLSSLSRSKLF